MTADELHAAWYGRRGYRHVRTTAIDDAYPHLALLLATPCDLAVYEKPLQTCARNAQGGPV